MAGNACMANTQAPPSKLRIIKKGAESNSSTLEGTSPNDLSAPMLAAAAGCGEDGLARAFDNECGSMIQDVLARRQGDATALEHALIAARVLPTESCGPQELGGG